MLKLIFNEKRLHGFQADQELSIGNDDNVNTRDVRLNEACVKVIFGVEDNHSHWLQIEPLS